MAQYKGSVVSATAAIDWHDILASGKIADGESGEMIVRCNVATRVAVGVTDPGTSGTAGSLIPAGSAVRVILGSAAAAQTLWVQSPASQVAVHVEVDAGGASEVIAVFA
jgi:hypothetical protein